MFFLETAREASWRKCSPGGSPKGKDGRGKGVRGAVSRRGFAVQVTASQCLQKPGGPDPGALPRARARW